METNEKGTNRAKTFMNEVGTEMRKTSWPTRQELVQQTIVVVVSVLLVGVLVGGVIDNVLAALLKLIIGAR